MSEFKSFEITFHNSTARSCSGCSFLPTWCNSKFPYLCWMFIHESNLLFSPDSPTNKLLYFSPKGKFCFTIDCDYSKVASTFLILQCDTMAGCRCPTFLLTDESLYPKQSISVDPSISACTWYHFSILLYHWCT